MINLPPARAKHFCNPGDLVASMAALKSYHMATGRKIDLLQQLDTPAQYYPGAVHGTTNDNGEQVCMNHAIYDMVRPLVTSQDYINDMGVYNGQSDIIIDIDVIRKKIFVNLPHGQIQAWIMYAYPDLAYNLSKPWITLPGKCPPKIFKQVKGKILLNFTQRYRNANINYFFLKKHKSKLIFAGTKTEHLLFVNRWGIDMPLLQVDNFLELAYGIANCKFMIGNQSMCWNLAEAMKTPRILELCEFAPNCMPFVGEKSYGFYHQVGLEHYVDILT